VKRFSQYRQLKLIQFGGYFATVCLCFSLVIPAHAQGADSNSLEIYHGCGMEGDARSPGVQALNRLKNRYAAPQQIDPVITLAAMLAPGRDTGRWKVKQGAEIVGYVFEVKVGGIESTNCHVRAAEQRDTHIELVLDPMAGSPTQRVIVEVNRTVRNLAHFSFGLNTARASLQQFNVNDVERRSPHIFDSMCVRALGTLCVPDITRHYLRCRLPILFEYLLLNSCFA